MNLKPRQIIVALGINIPLVLFNSVAVPAQEIISQANNEDRYLYDVLPPLPSSSSSGLSSSFLPETTTYTLDKGDVIRVSVFGLPDQGGTDEVFRDGTVTFPLIGNVNVKGKTIAQVDDLMTSLYSRYLKRPTITVTLEQPRSLNVAIVGEVNVPGNYTISSTSSTTTNNTARSNTSLNKNPKVTDLFELAGGLTVSADVKQVKLKRKQNNGQTVVYNLDFWKLLQEGDLDQDADLKDGDVIFVTKQEEINPREYRQLADASFGIKYLQPPDVTVVGEVIRPGAYTVPIDAGPPRLTTALQQSGGIRELADIRNIIVTRTTRDAQEQIIVVDLWEMLQSGDIKEDLILREGDTINVPRAEEIDPSEAQTLASANFSPAQITINVVGSVRRPGATTLPPNTTLNNAILAAGGFDQQRADTSNVELVRVNPNGTVTKRPIDVNFSAEINEENNPLLKNNDVVIVNRNTITSVTDTLGQVLSPIGSIFSFIRIFDIFRD